MKILREGIISIGDRIIHTSVRDEKGNVVRSYSGKRLTSDEIHFRKHCVTKEDIEEVRARTAGNLGDLECWERIYTAESGASHKGVARFPYNYFETNNLEGYVHGAWDLVGSPIGGDVTGGICTEKGDHYGKFYKFRSVLIGDTWHMYEMVVYSCLDKDGTVSEKGRVVFTFFLIDAQKYQERIAKCKMPLPESEQKITSIVDPIVREDIERAIDKLRGETIDLNEIKNKILKSSQYIAVSDRCFFNKPKNTLDQVLSFSYRSPIYSQSEMIDAINRVMRQYKVDHPSVSWTINWDAKDFVHGVDLIIQG